MVTDYLAITSFLHTGNRFSLNIEKKKYPISGLNPGPQDCWLIVTALSTVVRRQVCELGYSIPLFW
jgi:hypothetical protein